MPKIARRGVLDSVFSVTAGLVITSYESVALALPAQNSKAVRRYVTRTKRATFILIITINDQRGNAMSGSGERWLRGRDMWILQLRGQRLEGRSFQGFEGTEIADNGLRAVGSKLGLTLP